MQTIFLQVEVILPPSIQLETTCSEYGEHSPQIGNGGIIDFKKLNELIEHPNVQRLDISTDHPIFLEIKKMFEVILTMDNRSDMDDWKYRNTFLNVEYEAKKVQFVAMNWIDSFVTSFIMHLYH